MILSPPEGNMRSWGEGGSGTSGAELLGFHTVAWVVLTSRKRWLLGRTLPGGPAGGKGSLSLACRPSPGAVLRWQMMDTGFPT